MNKYINLLTNLNYEHWKNNNSYYSDSGLNKSMKSALTLIQNKGYLTNFNPASASDYTLRIEAEIKKFNLSNPDFEKLSFIFDLIQSWGGQTGRTPYAIKRTNILSSRQRYDEWKHTYLEGVKVALKDQPVEALEEWRKIDGIGASFAPKHLKFWTDKFPILDTRMSILLCGSKRLLAAPDSYNEFIHLITYLANIYKANMIETEKALFAFSQNYFTNEALVIRDKEIIDLTDFIIAEKISKLNN
jgi:hypothetical protein